MKILQILGLIVLVCSFSFSAKAQVDCKIYGLKFFVKDESAKIIENAKLQLVGLDEKSKLPTYVKLIRMDGAYFFASGAGAAVSGNFQVIISADGFETYQQKVNFPSCKIENYDVKLKRLMDKQSNSILTGIIYDANGAVIVGAKVVAINEKGEEFETVTSDDGVYTLRLSFNSYDPKAASNFKMAKYEITVASSGFQNYIVKNFNFIPSQFGEMRFDIALDTGNSNCGVAGCLPIPEPIETNKTEISDKILQRPLEELPKEQINLKGKTNKH